MGMAKLLPPAAWGQEEEAVTTAQGERTPDKDWDHQPRDTTSLHRPPYPVRSQGTNALSSATSSVFQELRPS